MKTKQGVKSVTALLLQQHCVLDVAIGPALQTLNLDGGKGGVKTAETLSNTGNAIELYMSIYLKYR